jgi:hypothetical protein
MGQRQVDALCSRVKRQIQGNTRFTDSFARARLQGQARLAA